MSTGAVLFGRSIVQLDDLPGDLDRFTIRNAPLRPGPRICAIRSVTEYPQHGIEGGNRIADQRLSSRRSAAVIGLLQRPRMRVRRGPQVVRNIVADLLDLPHQCLDAIQHQVEVLCNAIPFVVGLPRSGIRLSRPLSMMPGW